MRKKSWTHLENSYKENPGVFSFISVHSQASQTDARRHAPFLEFEDCHLQGQGEGASKCFLAIHYTSGI